MPNPTVEIKLEDVLVSIQKDLKGNRPIAYKKIKGLGFETAGS
jgi:hypothetical protein